MSDRRAGWARSGERGQPALGASPETRPLRLAYPAFALPGGRSFSALPRIGSPASATRSHKRGASQQVAPRVCVGSGCAQSSRHLAPCAPAPGPLRLAHPAGKRRRPPLRLIRDSEPQSRTGPACTRTVRRRVPELRPREGVGRAGRRPRSSPAVGGRRPSWRRRPCGDVAYRRCRLATATISSLDGWRGFGRVGSLGRITGVGLGHLVDEPDGHSELPDALALLAGGIGDAGDEDIELAAHIHGKRFNYKYSNCMASPCEAVIVFDIVYICARIE